MNNAANIVDQIATEAVERVLADELETRLVIPSGRTGQCDHGTIMSGSMVCATLADRKTKTRRVVTDRNSVGSFKASELDLETAWVDRGFPDSAGAYPSQYLKAYLKREVSDRLQEPPLDTVHRLYCRVQVGDRLWIRETFALTRRNGTFCESLMRGGSGRGIAGQRESRWTIEYAADDHRQPEPRWLPSIHMPRWASRITLEVTSIAVERVQDISDDDVATEGIRWQGRRSGELGDYIATSPRPENTFPPRLCFWRTWDSLNAPRGFGWHVNPLVWVISFKRVAA